MAKIDAIFKKESKSAEVHPRRITKWVHYTKLRDHKDQYCNERDKEEILALADLIEADGEVLQDLLVRKTGPDEYEIIAGHKRRRACRVLVEERGKEEFALLPCFIKDVSDVRAEFQLYSSNGYHEKSDYERMHELERMKHLLEHYPEEFPQVQEGRMVERLAKLLNMKKTTVGEYLTISKNLGEAAMEKFASGELKKSAAVQMASLPESEQDTLVREGRTSLTEVKGHKESKSVTVKESIQEQEALKPETEKAAETRVEAERKDGGVSGQLAIVDSECRIAEEPENPVTVSCGFPDLRNKDERENFVNGYRGWEVWCTNAFTEETFYRYNLPDNSAIVVKEYPYSGGHRGARVTGKRFYLVFSDTKYFNDAESNMTAIIEHLKNFRKKLA